MKRIAMTLAATLMMAAAATARTLIVYYSFTNNTHTIATNLQSQLLEADLVRIEPAEKGLDYAANGYAIGSALISAIRQNPDNPESYPAIDPVNVDFGLYDDIVVAVPLWWSNMAAPMQTFLFNNGSRMAGKRIGLIVSSASSGISGVEADAHRLIPDGNFVSPSLWIRSSQTSDCHEMTAEWLESTGIGTATGIESVNDSGSGRIAINGTTLTVSSGTDRLYVYNTAGKLMLAASGTSHDISRLQPGVYTVKLVDGDNESTGKIIINR